MDQNKLLTISIAAYNVESSIGRTLASLEIEEELFDCLDILIVDDGSADSTADIAADFAARHPGSATFIHKQNGGYGSTVNTSIRAAKGLFFKLLDGDDAFDRAGLEGLLKYLRCISGDPEYGDIPDLVISPFTYERSSSELCDRHPGLQTEPVRLEEAALDDGLMMFELCVRTEVLRQSGLTLTENCFYTDNEYVMAAELYASTAVRYPFPVYRYSIGVEGQSMSVQGRRMHYEDKISAARGVFDIYDRYCSGNDDTGAGSPAGVRKVITDRLLSTMAREVYVSLMIQDRPEEYRDLLRDFDRETEARWPYIYKVTGQSKLVSSARKAGDLTYKALCGHVLRSETKRMGEGMQTNVSGRYIRAAEYIAAACMIIQCRTVYMHLKDAGMAVNRSVWVVMMAALTVCVIANAGMQGEGDGCEMLPGDLQRAARRKNEYLILCAGMTVYAGVFILVNPVNYLRVIRCASAVLMLIVLLRSRGGRTCGRRIMQSYTDLMLVIAVISLLGWITCSVIKLLPFTGQCVMDWSHTGEYVRIPTFLGIYFETQWTDWQVVHARNSGIFTEAPMAGCTYSIAMMFDFMHPEITGSRTAGYSRKQRMRTLIFTAAILSTLSLISYGFLILILIAGMLSGERSAVANNGKKIVPVAAATAGSVVLAVLVINKLQLPSGNVRFNDFVVGFHAWLAKPFFGGGFESLEYLQRFMPEWRSFDTGFSNSPLEILGQGGIYLAAPYIYSFAVPAYRSIRSGERRILLAVMLFAYIFTFTVIPYQYITFFVLISLVYCTKPLTQSIHD